MPILERIKVRHFKNYTLADLACSPRLNGLVGKNGMGKTNLLDAIYYLCMCKSHFSVPDSAVVQHGADFFRLEGYFSANTGRHQIVAKVQPPRTKIFEKNQLPYPRLSEHVGLLPVVFVAPDDTQIATEGSEVRRRFIDNTLSQIDRSYLEALLQYNRLLRQRNALLKQSDNRTAAADPLLEVYDRQMVEPAQHIFTTREKFTADFRMPFLAYHERICGGHEAVSVTYRSQLSEVDFLDLMQRHREKDRLLQRTTGGIHRDDFIFQLGDHPLKRLASQGQLKSFILALKLAQYEVLKTHSGQYPLLLLDDIFDKLDQERVKQLLQLLLEGDFGQLFLTDTDSRRARETISALTTDFHLVAVENGRVFPI